MTGRVTLRHATTARGVPPTVSMRRLIPSVPAPYAAAALLPGLALLFHLKLLRSDPADAAVLATAPTAVRLWFSQRAEVAVTRVQLVGPRGPVALGTLARAEAAAASAGEVPRMPLRPGHVAEEAVVVPVRGPMPPGAYTITWRTMAADGHPVSGRVAFRVGAPAGSR